VHFENWDCKKNCVHARKKAQRKREIGKGEGLIPVRGDSKGGWSGLQIWKKERTNIGNHFRLTATGPSRRGKGLTDLISKGRSKGRDKKKNTLGKKGKKGSPVRRKGRKRRLGSKKVLGVREELTYLGKH